MKLFLDASVSPAAARALSILGFDVVDQRDVLPASASDVAVLVAAWTERRIVVARDYDMGELVLRKFAEAEGVVIVAFDFGSAQEEADRIAAELNILGDRVKNALHVIEPAGVRSRPYDIASP